MVANSLQLYITALIQAYVVGSTNPSPYSQSQYTVPIDNSIQSLSLSNALKKHRHAGTSATNDLATWS